MCMKRRSTIVLFGIFLTAVVDPYETLSQTKLFVHQVAFARVSYHNNREGANTMTTRGHKGTPYHLLCQYRDSGLECGRSLETRQLREKWKAQNK